jgi:hypothetical protein
MFALGRSGAALAPPGATTPTISPHVASVVVSIATLVVIGGFSASVRTRSPSCRRSSAWERWASRCRGVPAVVAFFWIRNDRALWQCVIAPAIGFVGLTTVRDGLVNYPTLTGRATPS